MLVEFIVVAFVFISTHNLGLCTTTKFVVGVLITYERGYYALIHLHHRTFVLHSSCTYHAVYSSLSHSHWVCA